MNRFKTLLRELTPLRVIAYIIGIILLGCGITMNTKTSFGVSPVISVAYAVSALLDLPFSVMTFVYYCLLILIQFFLLGKQFDHLQWLQIVASLLTSAFIQLFDTVLPTPEALPIRLIMLLVAIMLTGAGITLTIGARLVPNPADGLSDAISKKIGRSLGFSKNLLDFVCILIALLLGFAFAGHVIGIGLGTVAAVVLTGRFVALFRRPGEWLFSHERTVGSAAEER